MFFSRTNSKIKKQTQYPEVVEINTDLSLQDIIDKEREEILERNETLNLQEKKFRPIRTCDFLLMRLAMIFFPLNIILLFVWSFGKHTNSNRKAFARSSLIYYVILTIIMFLLLILLVLLGIPIIPDFLFNLITS